MRVIRDGQITEDALVHLDDDAELPELGRFTVSLTRWLAQRDALRTRPDAGLRINGDDPFETITGELEHVATLAIEFPRFSDGRGYSIARKLREQHGYTGELRATGDVLRDQLFFMARCGFDVFEVRADTCFDEALRAFDDFSVTYQPAADGRPPIYRQTPSDQTRDERADRLVG